MPSPIRRVRNGQRLAANSVSGIGCRGLASQRYEDLELVDGEAITVRCWPNSSWFNWPFFLTVGRARYIGVKVLLAGHTA
jgi:hypothetical protein